MSQTVVCFNKFQM